MATHVADGREVGRVLQAGGHRDHAEVTGEIDDRLADAGVLGIDLAHHFRADAVAEGIENPRDLEAVSRMGCDIGQGYLIARPMPKAEFASLLREDRHLQAAK